MFSALDNKTMTLLDAQYLEQIINNDNKKFVIIYKKKSVPFKDMLYLQSATASSELIFLQKNHQLPLIYRYSLIYIWIRQLFKFTRCCRGLLTMLFCKGVLSRLPAFCGPIDDDHIESSNTLALLNYEGVLTIDEQRSYKNDITTRRSCLSFIITFDESQYTSIIELMKNLHSKGLNVWSYIKNQENHLRRYITLFKAPK